MAAPDACSTRRGGWPMAAAPMTTGWCGRKLAQGFGRLIRRQGDRGLFVILSSAMPSRLLTAFPPEVTVSRAAARRGARRGCGGRLFGEGGGEPVAQADEALDRDAAFLGGGRRACDGGQRARRAALRRSASPSALAASNCWTPRTV